VLLLRPDQRLHLRQLARQTGSHAGTLMRELDKLSHTGLLRRIKQGNQVCYQADMAHPLFAYLAALFRKTHGTPAALERALQLLGDSVALACVFESMAAGTQAAGSNIDLLVFGDVTFAELVHVLYPLQQDLGCQINPVMYTNSEFAQLLLLQDAFAVQLLTYTRLWIKGTEEDFAKLVGHPQIAGSQL
jgi:predicted nucleotidyltransferase